MNKIEEIISHDDILHAQLLLEKTSDSVFNAAQKNMATHNLNPREAYILFLLYHLGHKATLTELAKYRNRKLNTISVQMTKMQKVGLVEKGRAVSNTTRLHFELTEKGLNTFYACSKLMACKELMSRLSDEERQQLITLLEKILKNGQKISTDFT